MDQGLSGPTPPSEHEPLNYDCQIVITTCFSLQWAVRLRFRVAAVIEYHVSTHLLIYCYVELQTIYVQNNARVFKDT